MAGIFLSYRREDAAGWAGRLSADLAAGFRRVNIFMDIDAIPPGVNFDEYIAQAVGSCDVLIALIGPRWLTIADKSGKRRLDDPEDFTRIEIATALKRNIRVIPALVGGATVPAAEDLPEDLKPLARRQAYQLADHRWNDDCKRLIAVLKPIVQTNGRIIHKVLGALGLALVLSLAGYGGKLWHDHYVKSKEEQEKVIQEKVAAEKKRLVDARKKAEGAYNAALNWQKRADEYAREANGYAQEAEASAKATIVSFPSRASSESAKSAVDSARQNAVAAREAAVRAEGAAKAAREAVVTVKTKAEEVVRATEPAVATLAADAAAVAEGTAKSAADTANKEAGSAKEAAAVASQAKDQVLAIVAKDKTRIAEEDQKTTAQVAADKQRLLEARKKAEGAYKAALGWQKRADEYAREASGYTKQAADAFGTYRNLRLPQAVWESAKSAVEAVEVNYTAAKEAALRAESTAKSAREAVNLARIKADEAAKTTDPGVAQFAAGEAAKAEGTAKTAASNAMKEANAAKDAASETTRAKDKVLAIIKDSPSVLQGKGKVTRGHLGVLIQKVTPEIAESLAMEKGRGALVANVSKDGPAEKAGVRVGDVIIEFDGEEIRDVSDLPIIVARTPVDRKVRLKVLRDKKEVHLTVTVGELKDEEVIASAPEKGELGMTVRPLTPQIAQSLGLERAEGVVVSAVEPGSAADEAGIRTGDVILEVGRKPIRSLDEYKKFVAGIRKAKGILLLVRRGENSLFLLVKPQN